MIRVFWESINIDGGDAEMSRVCGILSGISPRVMGEMSKVIVLDRILWYLVQTMTIGRGTGLCGY